MAKTSSIQRNLKRIKLAKKLDIILIKEEEGTPLSKKETKNKRVYEVNSKAIGAFKSNLDIIIAL